MHLIKRAQEVGVDPDVLQSRADDDGALEEAIAAAVFKRDEAARQEQEAAEAAEPMERSEAEKELHGQRAVAAEMAAELRASTDKLRSLIS